MSDLLKHKSLKEYCLFGVNLIGRRGKLKVKTMKKFFVMMVMLMAMVMSANAQLITDMGMISGEAVVYLEDGRIIPLSCLPRAVYHAHATIQECQAETANRMMAERARHFNGMYTGVYGAGMYPMYGGKSSSFSVQTKNVGFDTYSSEYGGYKSSSTGFRWGDVNVRMSNSGYSNSTATPSYTRSARSAVRTNMKNNAVSNASVRSTSASTGKPIKATKEVKVSSLIPNGF